MPTRREKELSDNQWAICVLNTYHDVIEIQFDWHHFSFLNTKITYQVRDLWQKKDLGETDKRFITQIASHDVLFLKLTPPE